MTRTNVDIDDEACLTVMQRYGLSTKQDAVNFALRHVAGEPLSVSEARALRGSGWEGDLDELRQSHRVAMLFIDTSAWVEFLRDTRSEVCRRVDRELSREIAVSDAVRMEVLAGARDEHHLVDLRRLLARATLLPTRAVHYDEAAALYRRCRRAGETPRRLLDCLIAAVAIDAATPMLHADADYEVLGRHTALRLA